MLSGLVAVSEADGTSENPENWSNLIHQFAEIANGTKYVLLTIGLLGSIEAPDPDIVHGVLTRISAYLDTNSIAEYIDTIGEMEQLLGDAAIELFSMVFHSTDYEVKRIGAVLLCAAKDRRATEVLLGALRHPSNHAVIQVLSSIGYLSVPFLKIAVQQQDDGVRRLAAEALIRFGATGIQPLIDTMVNGQSSVLKTIAWALSEIGEDSALDPLIIATRDTNEFVRAGATFALGRMQTSKRIEPLIQALFDPSETVRRQAAESLGETRDPRALRPLIATLRDKHHSVRQYAAISLGQIGDRRAVEALTRLLRQDSEPSVRKGAAVGLGMLGSQEAIPQLIITLRDRDRQMAWKAASALVLIGSNAVEQLIDKVTDKNKFVRAEAIWALGRICDTRAEISLRAALRDKNDMVRLQAVIALGEIGNVHTLPELHRLTSDNNTKVRGVLISEEARSSIKKIRQRIPH